MLVLGYPVPVPVLLLPLYTNFQGGHNHKVLNVYSLKDDLVNS